MSPFDHVVASIAAQPIAHLRPTYPTEGDIARGYAEANGFTVHSILTKRYRKRNSFKYDYWFRDSSSGFESPRVTRSISLFRAMVRYVDLQRSAKRMADRERDYERGYRRIPQPRHVTDSELAKEYAKANRLVISWMSCGKRYGFRDMSVDFETGGKVILDTFYGSTSYRNLYRRMIKYVASKRVDKDRK
jgi:hypothetical protein